MIKLVLSSEKVLDEKFPASKNGYDPFFVDRFFDKMLNDYRIVENNVLLSKNEYQDLLDQIDNLKKENDELNIEIQKNSKRLDAIQDSNTVSSENIDLLRRISSLEKYLFSIDIDPSTIK